jgi:DNA-binding IclR family transcriptional regulator
MVLDSSKKYNVPALEKALAIIETLAETEDPIGVSELCKRLDIPKTSVFFILNTLDQHQYILKTDDGRYKLGTKFISIGLRVLNKIDIRSIAKPFMLELLAETGFTVHLAVLDSYEAMYIEKVENQAFVKFSTYIGQRLPLHASGVGKALACHMSNHQLEELYAVTGLPAKTENTITSLKELKIALEMYQKQGYSIEDEEGEIGIRCIGSAILDHDGAPIAAVSITALRSDLPAHEIHNVGNKVRAIALKISEQLSYRP